MGGVLFLGSRNAKGVWRFAFECMEKVADGRMHSVLDGSSKRPYPPPRLSFPDQSKLDGLYRFFPISRRGKMVPCIKLLTIISLLFPPHAI